MPTAAELYPKGAVGLGQNHQFWTIAAVCPVRSSPCSTSRSVGGGGGDETLNRRASKSVSPPDLTEPAPPLVSESAGDEQVKLPEIDTELDACTSGTGLNTHCTFSMTAAYPLYDGKRKITTSSGQHQDSLSLMSSMPKLDSSGRCTLAHVCLNAVHSVNHATASTCVQTVLTVCRLQQKTGAVRDQCSRTWPKFD